MAQLELFQVVPPHDGDAKDVGGGKEPASSRGPLIRDWSALELDLDVEVLGVGNCGRPLGQDLFRIGAGEGGESEAVLYFIVSGKIGREALSNEEYERINYTFGSCKSSFSHCSAVLMDTVGSHAVEGKSLAESGVRGVSISLFT